MIYNDKIIYAGYSTLKDGSIKFRTAKTQARVHQLEAQGEGVTMTLLPNPVDTKQQAAKALIAMDYCSNDAAIVDLFVQKAKDENPFKKSTRVVRVKVPTQFAVDLTGAKVEVVKAPRGALNKVYPEIKMTPSEAEATRAAFNAKALA